MVNLKRVSKWNNDETENYVTTKKAITKIHKVLNHKKIEQMVYAYNNAGKLNTEVRKLIKEVVNNCDICNKNIRSKSKPVVAIS